MRAPEMDLQAEMKKLDQKRTPVKNFESKLPRCMKILNQNKTKIYQKLSFLRNF
jgi:hypothetical protein